MNSFPYDGLPGFVEGPTRGRTEEDYVNGLYSLPAQSPEHENYGAYNGQVNPTTFGEPRPNLLNAYQPRVVQLAFRFSF